MRVRFAAAAGSDQHGGSPGGNFERKRSECSLPGKDLLDIVQREHQSLTFTPFQKATCPAICLAASFGWG